MEKEIIIILNSKFSCTLTFLERFEQEMRFIAPVVPQGALLTVKQLSGDEYWSSLRRGEEPIAGMCMTYLVEHGQVPFELVPRTGRNPYPLQYIIK